MCTKGNCTPLLIPSSVMQLCREHLGRHPCDKRRNLSHYKKQFPAVDFSLVRFCLPAMYTKSTIRPKWRIITSSLQIDMDVWLPALCVMSAIKLGCHDSVLHFALWAMFLWCPWSSPAFLPFAFIAEHTYNAHSIQALHSKVCMLLLTSMGFSKLQSQRRFAVVLALHTIFSPKFYSKSSFACQLWAISLL